ncbi:MAG: GTP-binding protein [Henriciella sp.]|nr:GTP-binding protein [Henriciella sp.]
MLSGFLGSGKTTLLNNLMERPELRRTLIIINEFGEVGLDHDLMVHSSDDVVVEMSNGCVCCTLRRDLVKTLREVPSRFSRGGVSWFDRVILETTGIADPAPIINTIMNDPKISRLYRLDGVVVTVDAANGNDTLDQQIDAIKQAAVADRLLITKTDLIDPKATAKLRERLLQLNPAATQLVVTNGTAFTEDLFNLGLYDPTTKSLNIQNWLQSEAYEDDQDQELSHPQLARATRHTEEIQSICLTLDEPVTPDALACWFEQLKKLKSAEFLRMKGIINLANSKKPIVVHGVQHVFHPVVTLDEWPSEDRRSRIVFITRGIKEELLRDTLEVLRVDALTSLDSHPVSAQNVNLKTLEAPR